MAATDDRPRVSFLPTAHATLDAIPVPIVVADRDLTVQFLNRSMPGTAASPVDGFVGRPYE